MNNDSDNKYFLIFRLGFFCLAFVKKYTIEITYSKQKRIEILSE